MSSGREGIEQEAATWVAREDRGLDPRESAALSAWLDASVAHRVAWLRLKAGWKCSERLGALRRTAQPPMSPDWRRRAALAAGLLLALGAGLYFYLDPLGPRTFTTHLGERPVLHLADGTRVQLNTNTQVKTDMTRATRTVTLERGEAYFEVVHDDKRPFVVYAGNRRITDLGTKFSVRRNGDDIRVVVTEGRVRVDVLNTPVPAAPVYANGGNIVLAKADETLVASKSLKDLEDELHWRSGMLTFDQETLASAAEQFNRYNTRQILVEGGARDIRIGGSFRADNIDVFATLVRNALGLKVTQDENRIVISE